MAKASKGEEYPYKGSCAHKREEVSIIPSAYAIVDPYAMVVLSLYTIVTYSAMVTSWRPPNVASFAVFGRDIHGSICCAG